MSSPHNRDRASGPGALTPDGCAVELYKILAPRREPEIVHAALPAGADILELGAGTGRVTHGLLALGHAVTAVDRSPEMLAEIRGATTVLAEIADLDLGRRFAGVVLGSCLFNVVDDAVRVAFLTTCARHVAGDGAVLIEAHEPALRERARRGPAGVLPGGVAVAWLEVAIDGDVVDGTLEYRYGSQAWTQSFGTRVFERPAIERELRRGGLRYVHAIDANWFVARADTGVDALP